MATASETYRTCALSVLGPGATRRGSVQCRTPANLGQVFLVHFAACFRCMPVMRAPISIERAKQPVRIYHFRQSPSCSWCPPRRQRTPNRPCCWHRPSSRSNPTIDQGAIDAWSHPGAASCRPSDGGAVCADGLRVEARTGSGHGSVM